MVIATAKELTKEYGTDIILSGVSFHVQEGDRIGIVGPNGAGKTTLLKLMAGELPADDGTFSLMGEPKVGYLHQNSDFHSENTIREEVSLLFTHLAAMEDEMKTLAARIPETEGKERDRLIAAQDELAEAYKNAGGYTYQSEIRGILTSMAFSEDRYDRPIAELSGGEKTRLALALILLQKPDILLLDEPTNHLDIGTLQWLEQYLMSYNKTLLVVSHDRYFLDRVCRRIFDVENHTVTVYEGNYTEYAKKKELAREEQARRYEAYQKEKERQEDLVRRYKQRGTEKLAKRARSREIKLEKMEEVAAPTAGPGKMKISFKERYQSGNDVLLAEDLAKRIPGGSAMESDTPAASAASPATSPTPPELDPRPGFGSALNPFLFEHVNLDIKRGEKICLVGQNGIGKTTLLRLILGRTPKDAGRLTLGHNVKPAYYDQEQRLLNDNNTVLDEVHDEYRTYTATELRSILGRFLFRGDDVFRKVGDLSGGEKARLALLKLMMTGANFLLLDEPTNHLDIDSREIFEQALMEFPGTALIVSHDRYFLNKVPDRIVELTEDGLTEYLGKYDYYTEKKAQAGSGKRYLKTLREKEQAKGLLESAKPGATPAQPGTGTAGASATSGNTAASAATATSVATANEAAAGAGISPAGADTALSSAEARRLKKAEETARRREERKRRELEERIESTEQEISDTEQLMCTEGVLADPARLRELDEQLKSLKADLEEAYEQWAEME